MWSLGAFGVLLAVIGQGFGSRSAPISLIAALIGVGSVYLLVFARIAVPAERSHLIEYSVLAGFIYLALLERVDNGKTVRFPALVAAMISSTIGLVDELVQAAIPFRVFDPVDIVFNTMASCMAVAAIAMLRFVGSKAGR